MGTLVGLLTEIQAALLEPDSRIGPILLKLRLLAARLGSDDLAEWVKHESEGYPGNVEIPNYRRLDVRYKATFSGQFGSGVQNAPIPPYLIKKFAGDSWVAYEVRQSVASIDDLVATSDSGVLHIDASNLILLLQGKVYEQFACNAVVGTISTSALIELQHAVRTRVLELTIQLESRFPDVKEIMLGGATPKANASNVEAIGQITNQVIYGNMTSITNSGAAAQISVHIAAGDAGALTKHLVDAGIPTADADEFVTLLQSERPESAIEPLGPKAKGWLVKNIGKAASGVWGVGVSVASRVLTEAALKYYGLK
jgi:hypothetical protein